MSLKVLLFQEDSTYNGFILRPVLSRLFAECGKVRVQFLPVQRPPKGYPDAVRTLKARLSETKLAADLWLFVADADGQDRSQEFSELERIAAKSKIHLVCCAAEPEIEAWLLAGHKQKLSVNWQQIRQHARLKEEIFLPFLKKHGNEAEADGGRTRLTKETLQNYRGLLSLCPELRRLEDRIRTLVRQKSP